MTVSISLDRYFSLKCVLVNLQFSPIPGGSTQNTGKMNITTDRVSSVIKAPEMSWDSTFEIIQVRIRSATS